MTSDYPIKQLSIYDKKNVVSNSDDSKPVSNKSKSFGVSAMMLLDDVKKKYQNAISNFYDFKQYATSTEGKVKFGLMFLGFAGGCVLSYRSRSNRLWFKRLLPVATLSFAAGVCYPHGALEVGKSVSEGVAGTYKGSRIVASYVYLKIKAMKEKMSETNAVKDKTVKESEYVVNETGIIKAKNVEESHDKIVPKSDEPRLKSIVNTDNTNSNPVTEKSSDAVKMIFTEPIAPKNVNDKVELNVNNTKETIKKDADVYSTLSMPANIEKKVLNSVPHGDAGQGSSEDADLYTTRS